MNRYIHTGLKGLTLIKLTIKDKLKYRRILIFQSSIFQILMKWVSLSQTCIFPLLLYTKIPLSLYELPIIHPLYNEVYIRHTFNGKEPLNI